MTSQVRLAGLNGYGSVTSMHKEQPQQKSANLDLLSLFIEPWQCDPSSQCYPLIIVYTDRAAVCPCFHLQ